MTITKIKDQKFLGAALLTIGAAVASPTHAIEFKIGEIQGSFDSTLSVGASWRVANIDKDQIAIVNGGNAVSVNYDDGDLNFKRGETFSKIFKGSHELELTYKNYGAFVRGRYFYDFELQDESREFKQLNKQALDRAGHSADILDSYVWGNFNIKGHPLTVRFGSQVINWGESTFIQGGINTINPVDVTAFRKPGAEIKEGLLPVNMISTSFDITDNVTLEAFYQLDWKPTEIDPCGTYFSTADFVSGRNSNGCGPVVLTEAIDDAATIEALFNGGILPVRPIADRLSDDRPDDNGQFGFALRWYAENLNDTEFGLYYINYHSRLPFISGVNAKCGPPGAFNQCGNMEFDFPDYFIEYPEDIELYGFSFQTTAPWGIALSGELSYRPDLPLQYNAFELLTAGNLFPTSVLADQITPGETAHGFERFPVLQGQVTMLKFFDQVLGADRLTVISEVGFMKVNGLKGTNEDRFGVSGKFGQVGGNIPPFDGLDCLSKGADQQESKFCYEGGYATAFSWGYRLRAALTFNNAIAGANLTPVLSWSHDVNGSSPGPGGAFTEGTKAIGLALNADYLNAYKASISYTNFFGGDFYNEINDRDFVSVNLSYSF